jgi:cytosine/adenosine deaminase-related metal-dependent hydrolase
MLQQGGMSNYEALRCATVNGAALLGMEKQLGTLTEGKLADLIVIDGNPMEDIRSSENVIYTMINGRLYDTATMNEVGSDAKRTKFFWEMDGSGNAYPYYQNTHSFMQQQCSCRM